MSELAIRREKMAREVRTREKQEYMMTVRRTLLKREEELAKMKALEEWEWRQMADEVERRERSPKAVHDLLVVLAGCRPEGLARAYVLKGLYRMLAGNELGWEAGEEYMRLVRKLLEEVVEKVVGEGADGLECCYMQLLQLLGLHPWGLNQLWQQLALVRSEVFYNSTIEAYIQFIVTTPESIEEVIPSILATFCNLLHDLPFNPHPPRNSHLLKIMEIIVTIFNQYDLEGQDLRSSLRVLDLAMQHLGMEAAVQTLLDTALFQQLTDCLRERKERKLSRQEVLDMLNFFGKCFSVREELQVELLKKNRMLVHVLKKMLPLQPFQHISANSTLSTKVDQAVVARVLLCLCNLAAAFRSYPIFLEERLFSGLKTLAMIESFLVREEVAILLFNCATVCNENEIELVLQAGCLQALSYLLNTPNHQQILDRSLSTLRLFLAKMSNLPLNQPGWQYSLPNLVRECERLGLRGVLEDIAATVQSRRLAELAMECLRIMGPACQDL